MSRTLRPVRRLLRWILAAALSLSFSPLSAQTPGQRADEFASGDGNLAFLAAGVALPVLTGGHSGGSQSLRVLDSLGVSALICQGLKYAVGEERPDHSDRQSFPSGHATAAFAVAATEGMMHPRQAPLWYAGAALISASRVGLHRHFIHDVIAGGLLGYFTARLEMSRSHGLLLFPFIGSGRGQPRMALVTHF